jgi:hypothetical protein
MLQSWSSHDCVRLFKELVSGAVWCFPMMPTGAVSFICRRVAYLYLSATYIHPVASKWGLSLKSAGYTKVSLTAIPELFTGRRAAPDATIAWRRGLKPGSGSVLTLSGE